MPEAAPGGTGDAADCASAAARSRASRGSCASDAACASNLEELRAADRAFPRQATKSIPGSRSGSQLNPVLLKRQATNGVIAATAMRQNARTSHKGSQKRFSSIFRSRTAAKGNFIFEEDTHETVTLSAGMKGWAKLKALIKVRSVMEFTAFNRLRKAHAVDWAGVGPGEPPGTYKLTVRRY